MAKRTATTELNHDNWNEDDEVEEAGNFQQAPVEVLQTRVIRQAKRKIGPNSNSGEEKANVFAGFSGFGASTPKPATSLFSFLGQTSTPTTNVKKTENGSKIPPASEKDSNEEEYFSSLKVLNEAVSSWVAEHVKKNPCCVLTPVFQDYDKYLKELEEKRKVKRTKEVKSSNVTQISSEGAKFQFGKALDSPDQKNISLTGFNKTEVKPDGVKKDTETGKFEFGKAASSEPSFSSTGSGSSGSNSLSSSSTFSFGMIGKPSGTSTAPFTFGSTNASATASAPAPFSFGFGSISKPLSTVEEKKEDGDKDENDEDDEDTPPKLEIKKVEEDDAFYSIRCKLFYKKDSSYAEKGLGTLFLKKVGDDKTQLVIRAETSLGNILLNIFLNPQLSTQRVGKNNVMLVCIPNPPIDPKTPAVPTPMLFRVKTDKEADELLQKLNDAKK